MTRAVEEWIGKTDDTPIPPRVRLRIFDDGRCKKCTRQMRPGHWACDHIIALANGGENRESNLQALCSSPCHSNKTRRDVMAKSETARKQRAAAGIKPRRRSIPGRRFNGDPIPARWIE